MKSKWRGLPAAFLYGAAGGLFGLLYVILDEGILDQAPPTHLVVIAHEMLDAVLPLLLGIFVGLGIHLWRRQRSLNRRLSAKTEGLKQGLLFHALISQILHEVQNPLHNLLAVLEESRLPDERLRATMQQNLERLKELKGRYGRAGEALEGIRPEEPLDLVPWYRKFLDEEIAFQLKACGVRYAERLEKVRLRAHPILMEQIFLSLFGNALRALEAAGPDKRQLELSVREARDAGVPQIEIALANTGAFAPDVLASQGRRPVASERGMGLGLLLVRSILEQVGGSLEIANDGPRAVVRLRVPGEKI